MNHVLDGGLDLPMGRDNCMGGQPIVKYRYTMHFAPAPAITLLSVTLISTLLIIIICCARMAESMEMPYGWQTQVGPVSHQIFRKW